MRTPPTTGPAALKFCLLVACVIFESGTRGQTRYQKPPKAIVDILDGYEAPAVLFSPDSKRFFSVRRVAYPSIAELANPMLALAGLRINPSNSGPHRLPSNIGLTLKDVRGDGETEISLPVNARISFPVWSPDSSRFAYALYKDASIELWVGDGESGDTTRMKGVVLNDILGETFQWMPDSRTLLCLTIPKNRGQPPPPEVPIGPTIQESFGKTSPVRTYQNLLKNPHDKRLFDYYGRSQLVRVDTENGKTVRVGESAIFQSARPSPDGRHILVARVHRPYSYLSTAYSFPKEVEVWDLEGNVVHRLASLPLAEGVPIGGVPIGPRSYHWKPVEPATLVWVEALDEGNPKKKVSHRDRILQLRSPFQDQRIELAQTEHRYRGMSWSENGEFALLSEYDRDRRWMRTHVVYPENSEKRSRVMVDISTQDRYNNPGSPVMRMLPNGHRVLWQDGLSLFLRGNGASPRGDHPFLDRFDVETFRTERLFQCQEGAYESVVALTRRDASEIITRRETRDTPRNYFVKSTRGGEQIALTDHKDPMPQLRGITTQLVTYERDDGVRFRSRSICPVTTNPALGFPLSCGRIRANTVIRPLRRKSQDQPIDLPGFAGLPIYFF